MAKRKLPGRKIKRIDLRVDEKNYPVDLRLLDNTTHSSRPDLAYVIHLDDDGGGTLAIEGPDMNDVIARATKVIEDRMAIAWKDVLRVEVDEFVPDYVHDDDEEGQEAHEYRRDKREVEYGFTLQWVRHQTGRRGTEPCHRENRADGGRNNSHIWAGELTTGEASGSAFDSGGSVYAVIDDTLANREALTHIGLMLNALQGKLNEVLSPKAIQSTLLDVQGKLQMLLPAPAKVEVITGKPKLEKKRKTKKGRRA